MKVSLILLALWLALASQAAEFYVAPDGSDAGPGTITQPFATLRRAQQAARQAAGREPVSVSLRAGIYYLPETFVLTSEDSGTKTAPVTYQAYQKEQAVISGGLRLQQLRWEPYRDGIMKATVPAGLATDQLFVNGERQPMARYPNFDPNVRHFNGFAADAISPERAARWADPRGGFIHAMHAAEWGGMHYRHHRQGAGQQDHLRRRLAEQPAHRACTASTASSRTSSRNSTRPASGSSTPRPAPSTSTRRPDWIWPRRPSKPCGCGTWSSSAAREQAPVRFVTLKGLTFRHAARTFMDNQEPLLRSDWTTYRGGAVFLHGHRGLRAGGLLHRPGRRQRGLREQLQPPRDACAAATSPRPAATASPSSATATPPAFRAIGTTDPRRSASFDRTPGPKTDNYPADCLVDDCLIYLTGRVEKQTAPVQIELSQGITVRHCSLYDVPRAGINIGDGCWGGHVIEFCDIFDTVKETGDHGSFNSWGRDRFWGLHGLDLNDDQTWEAREGRAAAGRGQDRSSCATTAGAATTAGTSTWTTAPSNYEHPQQPLPERRHQEPRGLLPRGGEQHHGQQRVSPARLVQAQPGRRPAQHHVDRPLPAGRRHAVHALGQGDGLQPRPPRRADRAASPPRSSPSNPSATRIRIVADAMFVDPASGRLPREGRLAGAEAGLRELPHGPVRRAEARS